MTSAKAIDNIVRRYAVASFNDTSTLTDAGLESMSVVRIIVDLNFDPAIEIDMAHFAELRTVTDLKRWLSSLAVNAPRGGGAR
jgi:acyl carrier protein